MEKKDETMNTRQYANGRKQQDCMMKESTLPTVMIEEIFITSGINMNENRQALVVDLP